MKVTSFLYNYYSCFYHNRRYGILGKLKFYSVMVKLMLFLFNTLLPLYYIITSSKECNRLRKSKKGSERIIVSLTSFPRRIGTVWLTIESLIRQTQKPDMIILWLSLDQFPFKEKLPKRLLEMEKRGLEIRLVHGDIRSYKKFYYAIKEFVNDKIILVDDDFIYNSDLVYSLIKANEKYPNSICARYGYYINRKLDGSLNKYSTWTPIDKDTPPIYNGFFGSGGGTLINPKLMHPDLYNIELARDLCPTADDIFLNAMTYLCGTPICFVPGPFVLANIRIPNDERLASQNVDNGNNMNDIQIKRVEDYYNNLF